ncbi:unnamed protein product [marine sediment metagenome]|uniref:Uncharacterized protein n=1 Tax=marine sediment metagenome TaxID=412755 RepID=X1CPG5_9ZZZZ
MGVSTGNRAEAVAQQCGNGYIRIIEFGGDNWILMWDENKDGGFVPGSAQQCCL